MGCLPDRSGFRTGAIIAQHNGVALPRNRAHGAGGQNRSSLIKWAAKQEKFQPKEMCFSLTSTFIELPITNPATLGIRLLPVCRQLAKKVSEFAERSRGQKLLPQIVVPNRVGE